MEISLLPIFMDHFDIIIGMDWLSKHRETIDCDTKQVIFGSTSNPELVYQGIPPKPGTRALSAVKAERMIWQGCEGFLATLQDPREVSFESEPIRIVNEFLDVFPDELPGIPPEREVEFTID